MATAPVHGIGRSSGALRRRVAGKVGALGEAIDRLAAPTYDVLGPAEHYDLVRLLQPLARAASAELPYPNAMGLPSL